MARIAGVDLPREKAVKIALTYIYGIGRPTALSICEAAEVAPETKTYDLDEVEVSRLRDVIERQHKVEGDLRREIAQNIKALMEMAGYITTSRADGERHGRIATFAEHNLSAAEEAELLEYLKFMRTRKKPSDQGG